MTLKCTLLSTAVGFGMIAGIATSAAAESHATTITIATVNNGDMVRMQGLTEAFNANIPTSCWNGSRWKKTCCART